MHFRANILLAFLLAFAGSGFVQKYAGTAGVLAYAAVLAGGLCVLSIWGRPIHALASRWFVALGCVSAVALIALFAILNPWEDGKGPGKSSDRDEGLNMAVERVFDGETPYYPANPIAGPLSILPGAVALAAPFVALGDSGYQNVFWIFAFFGLAVWHFRDRTLALSWVMIAVLASPAVAYEYISGGDLIANGIYVPLSFALAFHVWRKPEAAAWLKGLACVFVGVCLTSRSNLPFLMPLFGAAIWRLAGFRQALVAAGIVAAVILLLTVPIYLHDPEGFTPLMSRQKLAAVDHVIPHASWLLVGGTALAGVLAGVLLLRGRDTDVTTWVFRYGALVMIFPMVFLVVLQSVTGGRPDFSLMHDRFALLYLFFALLGWGHHLFGGSVRTSPEPTNP